MKDIKTLLANLHQVKAAAAGDNLKDPAEAGVKTDVDTSASEIIDLKGGDPNLNNPSPGTTPAEPDKVEQGGGPSAPSAESFTVEGAAAKTAASDFVGRARDLASKLAAAATPATPATPATAAPAVAATPATPATAAPAVAATPDTTKTAAAPGYFVNEVSAALLGSASGRNLLENALSDTIGADAAAKLVKSAACEFEEFEQKLLADKIARYEADRAEQQHLEDHAARAAHFEALMKQASEEDRPKIAFTHVLLKQAASRFENHPQAAAVFAYGVALAEKVAEDVAGGAPPEAAAEGAAAAGGEPTMEELLQALAELVQSGQIPPEKAQEILQMLEAQAGGAEGGMPPGAEGGMPPGGDPAAAGPPPGMEEMPKAAFLKVAAEADELLLKIATTIE